MSATITVHGIAAMVTDGVWVSQDAALVAILNALRDPWGPSGSDPNPDRTLAVKAVAHLGGEIVSFDPTECVPGRVY
jgi:hypothetical protein